MNWLMKTYEYLILSMNPTKRVRHETVKMKCYNKAARDAAIKLAKVRLDHQAMNLKEPENNKNPWKRNDWGKCNKT